jgi:hypothetical protein
VFVNSPPPCGDCVLEAQLISNVCNDNGTPLNSNDDTWTVTVRATYDGSGGPGYLIYDGISAVPSFGLYGGPAVTLPVYSNSVQTVTLTFVDVVTGTCTDVLVVNNPCVPAPCQITTNVQNVRCDDNGTPSNPNDDTFSFEFRVTGANTGSGWTATGGISMTGNYGQTYMMTGYPISGGQICFTVVDNNNPNCTSSVCVTPPATCSGQCTLTATASTSDLQRQRHAEQSERRYLHVQFDGYRRQYWFFLESGRNCSDGQLRPDGECGYLPDQWW